MSGCCDDPTSGGGGGCCSLSATLGVGNDGANVGIINPGDIGMNSREIYDVATITQIAGAIDQYGPSPLVRQQRTGSVSPFDASWYCETGGHAIQAGFVRCSYEVQGMRVTWPRFGGPAPPPVVGRVISISSVIGGDVLTEWVAPGGSQDLASVLAVGNVAGAKIAGLTDPTLAQDAATKAYVDGIIPPAPTLASVLAVGNVAGAKIASLTDPTLAQDAATKAYVDAGDDTVVLSVAVNTTITVASWGTSNPAKVRLYLVVDTAGGARTITLPNDASRVVGTRIAVTSVGANTLTIAPNGGAITIETNGNNSGANLLLIQGGFNGSYFEWVWSGSVWVATTLPANTGAISGTSLRLANNEIYVGSALNFPFATVVNSSQTLRRRGANDLASGLIEPENLDATYTINVGTSGSFSIPYTTSSRRRLNMLGNCTITGFTFTATGTYRLKIVNLLGSTLAWPAASAIYRYASGAAPVIASPGYTLVDIDRDTVANEILITRVGVSYA